MISSTGNGYSHSSDTGIQNDMVRLAVMRLELMEQKVLTLEKQQQINDETEGKTSGDKLLVEYQKQTLTRLKQIREALVTSSVPVISGADGESAVDGKVVEEMDALKKENDKLRREVDRLKYRVTHLVMSLNEVEASTTGSDGRLP